ncbi:hypothetical protein AB4Z50_25765 [Paenibacillus sp. 2TAB26]|uniref:hypothetical protein n=1 Tax=Paenibacillus sp. 2TAB26 TaxID=3233005 RepID=UPI003F9E2A25
MTRRNQYNVSALKFTDDVHDFLEHLSTSRELSEWVAQQVKQEIGRIGTSTGTCSCSKVMDELKEIKQLLISGCNKSSQEEPEDKESKTAMKQISSDSINQLIVESDLEYGF